MRIAIHCRACDKLIIDTTTNDAPGSEWTRQHIEFEAYMHMRNEHSERMGTIEPLCEVFLMDGADTVTKFFYRGGQ